MVEPLLYAALGFLTASLVALFMGRALWNRAVRLTTHRIMRRLPLSRDEIIASRDLLRAEQAIEHRRLERQANLMRARMAQSLAEVGRRDAAIADARFALEKTNAKAADLEAREAAALKTISQLNAELDATRARLEQSETAVRELRQVAKRGEKDRAELLQLADNRRIESAAATTEIGQIKGVVASLEKQIETAKKDLASAYERLEMANEAFRAEAARGEATHQKLVETERLLAEALTRLETAGRSERALPEEDVALLRRQIERLAADIARAAAGKSPIIAGAQTSAPPPEASATERPVSAA